MEYLFLVIRVLWYAAVMAFFFWWSLAELTLVPWP